MILKATLKKIIEYLQKAKGLGADIVSFPELAITGYPPEDLLLKEGFVADNLEALKSVAKAVNDIVAIVGFVDKAGSDLYNAAAVIYKGEVKGICHKELLPNYGVFDEKRYFKPGKIRASSGWETLYSGSIYAKISGIPKGLYAPRRRLGRN